MALNVVEGGAMVFEALTWPHGTGSWETVVAGDLGVESLGNYGGYGVRLLWFCRAGEAVRSQCILSRASLLSCMASAVVKLYS